jgi:hypothetical protein
MAIPTATAIGVLVGSSLPRALRVAEVDTHSGGDRELPVLRHLGSPVPSQRLAKLRRQGTHALRESPGNSVRVFPLELHQHRKAGFPFHKRRDVSVACARDQVTFPVTGNCPVLHRRWPLTNRHCIDDSTPTLARGGGSPCAPHQPPGAQVPDQLPLEHAACLNVQAAINGFVREPHGLIFPVGTAEPACSLLGGPVSAKLVSNGLPQS